MYIRKLESLNRCVIPQHLRKQMQVNKGDYMMVSLSANELVAYKYTDNIFSYSNKSLAGIPRKIDSLGRLVILKEYARQLNLQVGEFLEILQLPDSPYLLHIQIHTQLNSKEKNSTSQDVSFKHYEDDSSV